jgi:hypothetical protein
MSGPSPVGRFLRRGCHATPAWGRAHSIGLCGPNSHGYGGGLRRVRRRATKLLGRCSSCKGEAPGVLRWAYGATVTYMPCLSVELGAVRQLESVFDNATHLEYISYGSLVLGRGVSKKYLVCKEYRGRRRAELKAVLYAPGRYRFCSTPMVQLKTCAFRERWSKLLLLPSTAPRFGDVAQAKGFVQNPEVPFLLLITLHM